MKQINWWNRIFNRRLEKFEKILNRKGSIIDIGCGPGFLSNLQIKMVGKFLELTRHH